MQQGINIIYLQVSLQPKLALPFLSTCSKASICLAQTTGNNQIKIAPSEIITEHKTTEVT
jgi:hypothetical protein